MQRSTWARARVTFALIVIALLAPRAAHAQEILWQEDFNGATYNDAGGWRTYDDSWSLGRTQFGLQPTIEREGDTSFARLPLRSFNELGVNKVRGTELISKQAFKLGAGLEVSMRLRAHDMRRGVVFGPYLYSERGRWPDGYLKEEIDFELLANMGSDRLWSNIWNDWNPRYGNDDGLHNKASVLTVPGMNYDNWTTYTARWRPDRVEWLVDGVVVRTEKNVKPNDPMNVRFNIWAPTSSWSPAYHSSLQPTNDPSQNVESDLDVDWVRVTRLPAPNGGKWGGGDGLFAQYFATPDLSDVPAVTRVDATLNFDWKTYSPDVNVPNDNFSARWQGTVASPFSENVTFYARADDGIRVWINDKLVIDAWKNQGTTEYSYSLPMTAGARVPIRVEYFEGVSGAVAQLKWSSASMPKDVVPQSQLYTGDWRAPSVNVTSPTTGFAANRVASVTGTASDLVTSTLAGAVERAWVRLYRADGRGWNGSVWVAGNYNLPARGADEWIFDLPNLPDGQYSVRGVASDMSGNIGISAAVAFAIDNQTPTIGISSPSGTIGAAAWSASGVANDETGGVASVSVQLQRASDGLYWNGQNFEGAPTEISARGTNNWSADLPALEIGDYVLRATATDKAGLRASSSANFSVGIVDKTAPLVSVDSINEGYSYANLSGISGAASDTDSGLASVTASLRRAFDQRFWTSANWYSNARTVNLSVDGGGRWNLPLQSMAESFYELTVTATDNAGNSSVANATFWIDRSAPDVIIDVPTGGVLNNLPATSGTATDRGPGVGSVGVALINRSTGLWWNGQNWTRAYAEVPAALERSGNAATWRLELPPLDAGSYDLRAAARDYLGNLRFSPTRSFQIAPSSAMLLAPSAGGA